MDRLANLSSAFNETFGVAAEFAARAPGRVNLIGEHTDYNDGFCLPMAIERDVLVVGRATDDGQLQAFSLEQDGVAQAALNSLAKNPDAAWFDYVQGCADVLQKEGVTIARSWRSPAMFHSVLV